MVCNANAHLMTTFPRKPSFQAGWGKVGSPAEQNRPATNTHTHALQDKQQGEQYTFSIQKPNQKQPSKKLGFGFFNCLHKISSFFPLFAAWHCHTYCSCAILQLWVDFQSSSSSCTKLSSSFPSADYILSMHARCHVT